MAGSPASTPPKASSSSRPAASRWWPSARTRSPRTRHHSAGPIHDLHRPTNPHPHHTHLRRSPRVLPARHTPRPRTRVAGNNVQAHGLGRFASLLHAEHIAPLGFTTHRLTSGRNCPHPPQKRTMCSLVRRGRRRGGFQNRAHSRAWIALSTHSEIATASPLLLTALEATRRYRHPHHSPGAASVLLGPTAPQRRSARCRAFPRPSGRPARPFPGCSPARRSPGPRKAHPAQALADRNTTDTKR